MGDTLRDDPTLDLGRAGAVAFLVGWVSLGHELLQVRVLAFLLDHNGGFLAIPIALLGLAVGSLYAHFAYRGSRARLVSVASAAVLPVLLGSWVLVFGAANTFFSDIHVTLHAPGRDAVRLGVYAGLFGVPYTVFGALLAALFAERSDRIGTLYAADLGGAGIACALVPLLLSAAGLHVALFTVLAGAVGLAALRPGARHGVTVGWAGATAGVAMLAAGGWVLHAHPNPRTLATFSVGRTKAPVEEAAVVWNAIARTSLLRTVPGGDSPPRYGIVQDNGLSNVTVEAWNPKLRRADRIDKVLHHALPYRLGMEPERILVVFAGLGRDLLTFDALSNGAARIVGVELNRGVVGLAHHPLLAGFRLPEFLARRNIRLVNEEGRAFLDRTPLVFDVIYVANNGAVHAGRTGHTRKFLDTYQAMAAYLDHLAPDGLIVFTNQPVSEKVPSFRRLFAERGLGETSAALFAFGRPKLTGLDTLVVKPSGFSAQDIATLTESVRVLSRGSTVLYAPSAPGVDRWTRLVTDPLEDLPFVTDDRPFTHGLNLGALRPVPTAEQRRDPVWVSSWVKVFTVLLFAGVSLGVAGIARSLGGRSARVPAAWAGYLLASGFGYMCVEIGLIAKTELLVGNPLFAVAVNLASYLIANAVGAALVDRWSDRAGPVTLVLALWAGVAWSLIAVSVASGAVLAWPLAARVAVVVAATAPAGMAAGAFYPWAVQGLVAAGLFGAVPMSYGLATLSSVLGSTFAMTAIIDLGFSRVIVLGALAYAFAGVLAAIGAARSEGG